MVTRVSPRNLELALESLLRLKQDGSHISTSAINTLLSAAAERGDIERAMTIWNEFEDNQLDPTAESFGFAFEALGKHLARRTGKAVESAKSSCLAKADAFLSQMEKVGVLPTQHIVREYVELLCQGGEVETATSVVEEFLEHGLVSNKTLYRAAIANAEMGQFNVARNLASMSKQPMPFLFKSISRVEASALEYW